MSGQVVAITGSTKGIGKGLALEFVRKGCRVAVSGRNQDAINAVVEEANKSKTNHLKRKAFLIFFLTPPCSSCCPLQLKADLPLESLPM